jgi:NADH:ubiquinone oxidoreductase subunit 6 (subunit J)
MTTRPELADIGRRAVLGLIPLALFGFLAAVVLTTDFTGIDVSGNAFAGVNIVADMGYALIGAPELAQVGTENFLVALVLVAILLDAALDGALMLAKRDDRGEN